MSAELDIERRESIQKHMAMQDRSRIEQSVLTMVREEASAKEAQQAAALAAVTQQVPTRLLSLYAVVCCAIEFSSLMAWYE